MHHVNDVCLLNGGARAPSAPPVSATDSFVVQDEIHWNNAAVTIHPFVCYYVDKGKLTSLWYIVISESLQHDTVAVHLFQKKFVEFLTQECGGKKSQKMVYLSDGCAAQYKNCKNFSNLCHHLEDFGVTAEWHFFLPHHMASLQEMVLEEH